MTFARNPSDERADEAGWPWSHRQTFLEPLRHSAAMQLLQNGVDRTVIALWLCHESVESMQMYVYADIKIKEQAMTKTQPVAVPGARYRPDDALLAFVEGL
jgi:integrase/recombinase XerD